MAEPNQFLCRGNRRSARRIGALLAACLAIGGSAAVFAADLSPPTTAPSDPQISALVDQLGDEDFSVREAASAHLLSDGAEAKPELEKAAHSDNPEVRWRALELLKRLSVPPVPGEAPPGTLGTQIGLSFSSTEQPDGSRISRMTANGRTVEIEQGPAGIKMTVHGYLNGKPGTEHFEARDQDALKNLSPEVYALWQMMGSGTGALTLRGGINGGPIILRGGVLIMGQQNLLLGQQPVIAPPLDDLAKFRLDLNRQMDQAKLLLDQRKQVWDQVDRIQSARDTIGIPPANALDVRKRQDDYLKACDDLRKQLAALKLPDPGAALPPPSWARLGVTIGDGGLLNGVGPIMEIEPASRGQKLGLQPGDVVQSINGKATRTVADLRDGVTANRQLVLSVIRNGQMITLRETAPVSVPQ